MSRLFESGEDTPKRPRRHLSRTARRVVLAAAIAATSAMAPGIATARGDSLKKPISLAALSKQKTYDMWAQQQIPGYNGVLVIKGGSNPGGTAFSPEVSGGSEYQSTSVDTTIHIDHPLVLFQANPHDLKHDGQPKGRLILGQLIDRDTPNPNIQAIVFDPKIMRLVPSQIVGAPLIEPVVFENDPETGVLNLDEPVSALGDHHLLLDPKGTPWQVGLAVPA